MKKQQYIVEIEMPDGDFISGMLANVSPAANQWTTPEIVSAAIEIADELIKRLKIEK